MTRERASVQPSPRSAGRLRWLFLVLAVGSAVRLANLWSMARHPLSAYQITWAAGDMAANWEWSGRILAGDVLGRDTFQPYLKWMERIAPRETWERWRGKHVFHKAPLYSYVLAGMRLVGGDGFWGFGLAQAALGLLNVWLVFLLAERFFGLGVATLAGLGAALYGPCLLHETLVLRDGLGVSVSLLLLWGLARCTGEAPRRWFAAGILFAIALLGRELTLVFLPFVVLWAAQRFWGRWPALGKVLLAFAAGAMLGLAPLFARNLAVGIRPWALSSLGLEALVFGHAADAFPLGFVVPPSAKAILLESDGRLGPALRLTLATYEGDWWRLVRNQALTLAAVFSRFEGSDNVSWYYFRDQLPILRWSLPFEIVLALAVVGFWLARKSAGRHRILWYFLLAAFAGMIVKPPVVGRYRLVPAAVLMIYAGVAVVTIGRALRDRRWKEVALSGAAVVAVVIVSANLLGSHEERLRYRATEFLFAANAYYRQGEPSRAYEQARAGLETAYVDPAERRLPRGYDVLAEILVYAAAKAGRTADAAVVLRKRLQSFDRDEDLRRLLAEVAPQAGG